MAQLTKIVTILKTFAPLKLAGKWDNVGLLVEPSIFASNEKSIKKILLTNDLTTKVMQEAVNINANMIISYHPPIFGKGFLRP